MNQFSTPNLDKPSTGDWERSCGARAALDGLIRFSRPDNFKIKRAEWVSRDNEELALRWRNQKPLLSGIVTSAHLNQTGAVFGGNIISWLHKGAKLSLSETRSVQRVERFTTVNGQVKFSRPILEGDTVCVFRSTEEAADPNTNPIQVDLVVRERRKGSGDLYYRAASGGFSFEPTESREDIFDVKPLLGLVKAFSLHKFEYDGYSNTRKVLEVTDLLCCQEVFLKLSGANSERVCLPTHFVSRYYHVAFAKEIQVPKVPQIKIEVTSHATDNGHYHVRWGIFGCEIEKAWARGEMVVIDATTRREQNKTGEAS